MGGGAERVEFAAEAMDAQRFLPHVLLRLREVGNAVRDQERKDKSGKPKQAHMCGVAELFLVWAVFRPAPKPSQLLARAIPPPKRLKAIAEITKIAKSGRELASASTKWAMPGRVF
jgi:hypothetical protein